MMCIPENPDLKSELIAGQTPIVFMVYQSQNNFFSHIFIHTFSQRWATPTLKIALLPLFSENNSGATPPVTEQK